jgi:phenylpropionate dioxygenase-like ring-hydroxylating dioxygenase large terminal subunit
VKVGRWGGFVFINMDPNSESLESYMGDMGMHWDKFPLEDRYIAAHVHKIVDANWKVASEAFMEAYHAHYTHPQFGLYFGAQADSQQYETFGNYSRALGFGEMLTRLDWKPDPELQLDAQAGHGFPDAVRVIQDEFLKQQDEKDIVIYELGVRREALRKVIGDKVDQLTPFEIYGGGYFTLFPNFHPWWAYDEITYRFRPYKDEHEKAIMEVFLLRPFKGERPKPVPTRYLKENDSFLDVADILGVNARTFEQDEFNMPSVQKGLHNLKTIGKGVTLGAYQATKIRHFHKLWDKWVYGDKAAE